MWFEVMVMKKQQFSHSDNTVEHFLTFLFRGLNEGLLEMEVAAAHLYQSVAASGVEAHSEEEVAAIVSAIDRVNQRWPGAFVSIFPPTPKPDDWLQTIWILDSRAFSTLSDNPHRLQTVIDVALGRK